MEIILYKYAGNTNVINKTLPNYELDLQGSLREGTSVLSPSILIESSNYQHIVTDDKRKVGYLNSNIFTFITGNKLEQLFKCNYCYIPEFKRYYWVNNIVSVRSGLWRLDMKVDVLNSYKKYINEQTEFVTRYENASPSHFKDNLAVYSPVNIIEETIPNDGTLVNTQFDVSLGGDNSYNIVVSTLSSRGLMSNYEDKEGISLLPKVDNQFLETPCVQSYVLQNASAINELSYDLTLSDYSKYSSFVLSAIRFPMVIPHLDVLNSELYVGNNASINGIKNAKPHYKNFIVADFTYYNNDITPDIYEQTIINIYCPYVGWVKLNTQDFISKHIIIVYNVNYTTGEGNITILDYDNNKLLYTSQCQIGIALPVNTGNQYDVNTQMTSNYLNFGLSLLNASVGIASGNPYSAAKGVSSATSSFANLITGQMTNYNTIDGNVSNSLSGNVLPQKVRIKTIYPKRLNKNVEFAKNYGFPYNSSVIIKDLLDGKYFICKNVQLNNIGIATKQEQDEIKSLLENGVYK